MKKLMLIIILLLTIAIGTVIVQAEDYKYLNKIIIEKLDKKIEAIKGNKTKALILLISKIDNIIKKETNETKKAMYTELKNYLIYKKTNIGIQLIVKLDNPESEAYILNEKEEKNFISSNTIISPLDKLVVKEGSVSIENETLGTMKLNYMGELELDKNGGLKLNQSDLWIDAKNSFTINTMYSKIKISSGSVVSISQNEALCTVYIISGSAEVYNLVGRKTLVGNLQKLTISFYDASSEEVDLALSKNNLDEFFKSSEWYIKNNGN